MSLLFLLLLLPYMKADTMMQCREGIVGQHNVDRVTYFNAATLQQTTYPSGQNHLFNIDISGLTRISRSNPSLKGLRVVEETTQFGEIMAISETEGLVVELWRDQVPRYPDRKTNGLLKVASVCDMSSTDATVLDFSYTFEAYTRGNMIEQKEKFPGKYPNVDELTGFLESGNTDGVENRGRILIDYHPTRSTNLQTNPTDPILIDYIGGWKASVLGNPIASTSDNVFLEGWNGRDHGDFTFPHSKVCRNSHSLSFLNPDVCSKLKSEASCTNDCTWKVNGCELKKPPGWSFDFLAVYKTTAPEGIVDLRNAIDRCNELTLPPTVFDIRRSVAENSENSLQLCNPLDDKDNTCWNTETDYPYQKTIADSTSVRVFVTEFWLAGNGQNGHIGTLTIPTMDGSEVVWTAAMSSASVEVDISRNLKFKPAKNLNSWRTFTKAESTIQAFEFATITYKVVNKVSSLESSANIAVYVYPKHNKPTIANFNTNSRSNSKLFLNIDNKLELIRDTNEGTDRILKQSLENTLQFEADLVDCQTGRQSLQCIAEKATILKAKIIELPSFGQLKSLDGNSISVNDEIFVVNGKIEAIFKDDRNYQGSGTVVETTTMKFSVTSSFDSAAINAHLGSFANTGPVSTTEGITLYQGAAGPSINWMSSVESDPITVTIVLNNDVVADGAVSTVKQNKDNDEPSYVFLEVGDALSYNGNNVRRVVDIYLTTLPLKGRLEHLVNGAWTPITDLGAGDFKVSTYTERRSCEIIEAKDDCESNDECDWLDRVKYRSGKQCDTRGRRLQYYPDSGLVHQQGWSSFKFYSKIGNDRSAEVTQILNVQDTNDAVVFYEVGESNRTEDNDQTNLHKCTPPSLLKYSSIQDCSISLRFEDPGTAENTIDDTAEPELNFENAVTKYYLLKIQVMQREKDSDRSEATTHVRWYLNSTKMTRLELEYSYVTGAGGGNPPTYADYQRQAGQFVGRCGIRSCNEILNDIRFAADYKNNVDPEKIHYFVKYTVDDHTGNPLFVPFTDVNVYLEIASKSTVNPEDGSIEWASIIIYSIVGVASLAILAIMVCIFKKVLACCCKPQAQKKSTQGRYMVSL